MFVCLFVLQKNCCSVFGLLSRLGIINKDKIKWSFEVDKTNNASSNVSSSSVKSSVIGKRKDSEEKVNSLSSEDELFFILTLAEKQKLEKINLHLQQEERQKVQELRDQLQEIYNKKAGLYDEEQKIEKKDGTINSISDISDKGGQGKSGKQLYKEMVQEVKKGPVFQNSLYSSQFYSKENRSADGLNEQEKALQHESHMAEKAYQEKYPQDDKPFKQFKLPNKAIVKPYNDHMTHKPNSYQKWDDLGTVDQLKKELDQLGEKIKEGEQAYLLVEEKEMEKNAALELDRLKAEHGSGFFKTLFSDPISEAEGGATNKQFTGDGSMVLRACEDVIDNYYKNNDICEYKNVISEFKKNNKDKPYLDDCVLYIKKGLEYKRLLQEIEQSKKN